MELATSFKGGIKVLSLIGLSKEDCARLATRLAARSFGGARLSKYNQPQLVFSNLLTTPGLA